MDSKSVLARFDAERQALAMMDHPNIARVFDAGATDDGHPYFVMELVKGVPITKFCDDRKLNPRERLELFVQACQAIQHAHQKGIIHRDIKPSNVLVAMYDDRPVPKVIDFGVAKATGSQLTDHTLVTNFGAVVGTPEYMSPEQASFNQMDVDTRSDVYSLGVLLYELLTGVTPVDRQSLGQAAVLEILRIVREVEPPRPSDRLSTSATLPSVAANRRTEPSKLTLLLRGELDWVVMKALEKDRVRRYDTANALARDVQRYLADEIVEARPPSARYRLRKFVRKNRTALAMVSIATLLLVFGIATTSWQAVRAANAEGDARTALDKMAQALKNEEDVNGLLQIEQTNLKTKEEETRRLLYVSQLNQANAALKERNIPRVLQFLEDTTPKPGELDLRGWEWHYLDRLIHRGVLQPRNKPKPYTAPPEDGAVIGGAFTKNQQEAIWLCQSNEGVSIHRINVKTEKLVQRIPKSGKWYEPLAVGHEHDIPGNFAGLGVAFSADDSQFGVLWTFPSVGDRPGYKRLRIWKRDGTEIDGPAEKFSMLAGVHFNNFDVGAAGNPTALILGPNAEWAVLQEFVAKENPPPMSAPRDDQEYKLIRWERNPPKVITRTIPSKTPFYTEDGIICICWGKDAHECWDMAADPPCRLITAKDGIQLVNPVLLLAYDSNGVRAFRMPKMEMLWKKEWIGEGHISAVFSKRRRAIPPPSSGSSRRKFEAGAICPCFRPLRPFCNQPGHPIIESSSDNSAALGSNGEKNMGVLKLFELASRMDKVGVTMTRVGLIVVLLWIGGLKAFQYEADGIVPFVANSPFMSFFYADGENYKAHKNPEGVLNAENRTWHEANRTYLFAYGLGSVIVLYGLMLCLNPWLPQVAAVGSFLVLQMSFVTLSFLITTPECWVPPLGDAQHGFPYIGTDRKRHGPERQTESWRCLLGGWTCTACSKKSKP